MLTRQKLNRNARTRLAGVLALFSGVALLANIVAGVSLLVALSVAALSVAASAISLWRRATPAQRALLKRVTAVGAACGVLATVCYDTTKFALSQLDPSPYNPFEVLRIFGTLLAGEAAPEAVKLAVGGAFHLLNGVSFAVAYCFLFRKGGIFAGVLWGLFLELFQLSLYPGWLNIRFLSEFAQISALSHVVYGAVLGMSSRYGLHRTRETRSVA